MADGALDVDAVVFVAHYEVGIAVSIEGGAFLVMLATNSLTAFNLQPLATAFPVTQPAYMRCRTN